MPFHEPVNFASMISETSIVPSALTVTLLVEMLDDERAGRGRRARRTARQRTGKSQRRRIGAGFEMMASSAWMPDGYDAAPKLTFGTSRSAGALISKNSRGLKPNMPARIFEGNCAILVLKSRTTAL